MRQYLLTDKEQKIIQTFLESGLKLEGFNVLVFRCRNLQKINADLELVKQFLEKVKGSS